MESRDIDGMVDIQPNVGAVMSLAEIYWLAFMVFVIVGIVVGVYRTFTKIGKRQR